MRPTRAEPLYQLARYHRCKGNYYIAYVFAEHSVEMVQQPDVLFVDMSVYEWRILEELALSSYYVGKKERGRYILEDMIRDGIGKVPHYKNIMKWYV